MKSRTSMLLRQRPGANPAHSFTESAASDAGDAWAWRSGAGGFPTGCFSVSAESCAAMASSGMTVSSHDADGIVVRYAHGGSHAATGASAEHQVLGQTCLARFLVLRVHVLGGVGQRLD